jgi:F-type H+-transporting ATPase subunit delta
VIAGSLARRYARALMDLGAAHRNADKLGADVRAFAQAMKVSPELVHTLGNPAFPRADRKKILDALGDRFRVDQLTRNFVYVLLDRERLTHLQAISREIDRMIEEAAGRVAAEVVSAQPLTAGQLSQITAALEKLSGRKVQLSRREDPSLIGGVIAKVGDVVYDGSVRSQLRQLRDQIAK